MFDGRTTAGALAMLIGPSLAHAQGAQPLPRATAPPPKGLVIETGPSSVVVTGSGWTRDDNVEITQFRKGATENAPPTPERIASGRVLYVSPGRALVSVDMDTRIPLGAAAERTEQAHSDYPFAPGRLPGVVHAGFDTRTFFPMNAPAGVGMLSSAFGMVRLDAPVAVRLNALSGFVTPPGQTTLDGNVTFTIDTQYFEVGLGAGGVTAYFSSAPASFEVAHFLRVGAIDGLTVETQIAEYLVYDTFHLANVLALLQVPITRSWWLVMRAGGGRPAYWLQPSYPAFYAAMFYGEAGARYLLTGSGDRDSLFVTAAFGASGVPITETTEVYGPTWGGRGGPSLSFGLEWRL